MQKNITKKRNLKINYKDFTKEDNTENIVILHGWGGSSNSWESVGETLSQSGFNTYIPDLPGFGETKLEKVFDLEEYAIVIEEFIKELNLDNIILWGHSNGGAISIKIALRGKINIKRLILNNSAGVRNDKKRSIKRKILNNISKIIKPFFKLPLMNKVRTLMYRAIGGHDYLNAEKNPYLKETYLNIIKSDLTDQFENINIDTLLIWGEKDTYTPLSDGYLMREKIKKSKMCILDNETHGIHLKNPIRLIDTFLRNI